jgi:uncharacterized protein (DUF1330 family)
MAITPTREQFSAFAHDSREGEIVMINLLHFAEPADGDTDAAPEATGKTAYRDYSDDVVKMVEARGGRVVWTGQPEHVLIGDSEQDGWDLVVLVSYPSRQAFIDMVSSPKYQESHTHRERGLDRTVLLACKPMVNMVGTHA